jgi:hypothetical protein
MTNDTSNQLAIYPYLLVSNAPSRFEVEKEMGENMIATELGG